MHKGTHRHDELHCRHSHISADHTVVTGGATDETIYADMCSIGSRMHTQQTAFRARCAKPLPLWLQVGVAQFCLASVV
eukprot:9102304-Pyramimonas_sp.AAC.1